MIDVSVESEHYSLSASFERNIQIVVQIYLDISCLVAFSYYLYISDSDIRTIQNKLSGCCALSVCCEGVAYITYSLRYIIVMFSPSFFDDSAW